MKKIIFAFVAGCIPALAAMNGVNAQNSATPVKDVIVFNKSSVPANENAADRSVINTKALKHFSNAYKNASGERWMESKNGFRVKFSLEGKNTSVYYNSKGRWTGSLKEYAEDKLPFSVRDMVKRAYYDFSIFHVKEIETLQSEGKPTYIIYIEDKLSFKLIRAGNGEMDVYKEFKKQ